MFFSARLMQACGGLGVAHNSGNNSGANPRLGAVMKVIVFGPTGGTGRELVAQALAAGHHVTAFTRRPAAVKTRPRLRIVTGQARDAISVSRAMVGHDAVLCALGGRPWRPGARVCGTAMKRIVSAMVTHDVRRIVAISTLGAGDSRAQLPWWARQVQDLILASEVADKEAMEAVLAASTREWVAVRVGRLTDGPSRGPWRAADDGSIQGFGQIARADVARFMLAQLDSDEWLKRRPVLVY